MAEKGKIFQTVVSMAGEISPTLAKSINAVQKRLEGVNLKALAAGAAVGAIAIGTGKAVISATKHLKELGAQFDDVADTIRIGTGATGEALDSLIKDFDEVYKNVPTSMEDASKAIADYNTRLGLTGDELQGLSTQAIQVADMLGDDLGTVIESSSQAFQQWSVESENMGGAMDYIFKVSQSTGIGFSKLMENMQLYGAQMQTLGYSFEESASLIGQLEKAGANTEEVLAAMKKSVATLAKEGISASKGIDLYCQKIKNAGTEAEATAIASEIFGARAGSTLAAAIRKGTLSVGDLTKQLTESTETISGAAADTYDFAEILQMFKQRAQVALKPLANTVFDSINKLMPVATKLIDRAIPIIERVVDVAAPFVDEFVGALADELDNLLPLIDSTSQFLVSLASNGLAFVKENGEWLIPVVTGLTAAFAAYKAITIAVSIAEAVKTAVIASGATTMTAATVATWALNGALGVLMSPVTLVIAAIAALVAIGVALWQNWDKVKVAAANLGEFLLGCWNRISSAVGGFLTGIKEGFSNVFNGLVSMIKQPINAVIRIINGAINGINAIGFDIPEWVPLIGGKKFSLNIPNIPMLATGGFTNGVSIAGEAGQEAVISFDPAYRSENLSYWAKAGRMLGANAGDYDLGATSAATVDVGGITFSPNISVNGNASKQDIIAAIEETYPEFVDLIDRILYERGVGVYA